MLIEEMVITVDMKEAKIFDANEPISKALDEIMASGTAAFIVKDKQLFGLIDDRNIRLGISDASRTKCESASVKCPSLKENADIPECIEAFLAGHFKALPVVDGKGKILGTTTRADLLRELATKKLVPHAQVYQYMGRPVYMIDEGQTVADAKSMMKKTGAHHLAVTRLGNIIGTVSTLDLSSFLTKPKERQSYQLISEVKSVDAKKVSEIMRENFATIDETATLDEAAIKMAAEGVSSIVVVANKKPTGLIAATDIFKQVRKAYAVEKDVLVSGLDENTLVYYGKIKEEILAVVKKFEKSLKIDGLTVHIKKGKSVYEANMAFELNNKHTAFKCEAYNIGDTIAALSNELKILLEKAKSEKMEKKKVHKAEEE